MPEITGLSREGRIELALALILWKDFKSGGRFDVELIKQVLKFADYLGVRAEYDAMLSQIPPMEIKPR